MPSVNTLTSLCAAPVTTTDPTQKAQKAHEIKKGVFRMNGSATNHKPLIVSSLLALAMGVLLVLSAQGFAAAYIGEAKAIAFEHAKVTESGVYKFELELKEKRRRMIYEVEFKHNGMEYEYEIDAVTGAVLRWEAERD